MIIFGKGLYLILTSPAKGYERMTEIAVAEGVPVLQLRYKQDDIRELVRLAHSMRKITRDTHTKLIINDRVDIACICETDGVHLGQKDIPPKEARAFIGDAMIIGLSTHNLDQVEKAQSEPVDYIGFGPVYKPFLKDDHDPVAGV
jgi:thiamine-phosphate pyrophosphorylase